MFLKTEGNTITSCSHSNCSSVLKSHHQSLTVFIGSCLVWSLFNAH